jgi:hypothetical protein
MILVKVSSAPKLDIGGRYVFGSLIHFVSAYKYVTLVQVQPRSMR